MESLTPAQIVSELDKHIVGQRAAKRAVAISLRSRWRRMQLNEAMQAEITPKNILMIGPTGVGKTEIARRLAKLAKAPFIKVEATRFTEVGYVGREVDSIVKDLVEVAYSQCREEQLEANKTKAQQRAEERMLDLLLRPSTNEEEWQAKSAKTREHYRGRLRAGELDDNEVTLDVNLNLGVEIMGPPGMEEMTSQLQKMFSNMRQDKGTRKTMKVREALAYLREEEAAQLVNESELRARAIELTEQSGIVFIDEIDKIVRGGGTMGADVSREGVQRDLLPLIEGSTITTRLGPVRTDYILFIASGAFQLSKPADLIPELQGRLPIRVELEALGIEDLRRILVEPDCNLLEQYKALMQTEKLTIHFADNAATRIAELAHQVNQRNENIGARRLHTLLEKLLDEISFESTLPAPREETIDAAYVDNQLAEISADEDLSKYIL